ncbi:MAG: hypothetical protein B7Z55_05875 [Planctomycetales bacterium 12-60-4]|nr:MAG: hypothetical protein B7Z55_05875 [Planctomycetales bacterium 12-60-4]
MGSAATDYRNAAEALRRAARSANGNAPSMAQQSRSQSQAAGQGGTQPNDVAAPAATGSLAGATGRLQSVTPRNWGRLGGALKTDLLDGGPMASHPEYARQIQRYFETIARDPASTTPANGVTP